MVKAVSYLLSADIASQCLYLAHTELRDVSCTTVPLSLLLPYAEKLVFLFSLNDHWNPLSQQQHLRQICPNSTFYDLPPVVQHAFVIGQSHCVAATVWNDWMKVVSSTNTVELVEHTRTQESNELSAVSINARL